MLTRRACLVGGAAAAALPSANAIADEPAFDPRSPLPHKDAFFPLASTYLNCASQHPLSRGATRAAHRYLEYRTFSGENDFSNAAVRKRILAMFAQLINAAPREICFVQSTTTGENLVIKALDIPRHGGRIVTDELHWFGSFPTYAELAKQGMEVVTLRTKDGTIDPDAFEAAVTRDTRLVAVSAVSTTNGFQHDLKRVCEITHAKGAPVYADIIHQVGSTPIDVRDTGVDFCASASYKWLMGEMGLGFLYVQGDRLEEISRPWFGHNQLARHALYSFPDATRGERLSEYEHFDSALGYFAMGTQANIVAAILDYSLRYLLAVGVERIQAYRQPMIDRLQEELPRLGYASITPRESRTAVVSFRHDDAEALAARLRAREITVTVRPHHVRISPSVFNDHGDVDRLISALA